MDEAAVEVGSVSLVIFGLGWLWGCAGWDGVEVTS